MAACAGPGSSGGSGSFLCQCGPKEPTLGRMKVHRSYARIRTVFAVVWTIILVLGALVDRNVEFSGTTFEVLLLVFGGSVIGWVAATIARARGGSTTPS